VWGWRVVFLLAAAAALLALTLQAVTLPSVSPGTGSGLRALGSVLRSVVVLVGLLAVLLIFAGHFIGFTYVRVAAHSLSGIDSGGFAVLLLVFGVAGLAGTVLAGPVADHAPQAGVFGFPFVLGVGLLVMFLTGASFVGLLVAAAVWGLGFGGVPTTVLSWGARTEPTRLEQMGGLIVTVCNIGIALGAAVGGVLVDRVSASAPLLVGGVAAVAGAAVLVALRERGRRAG
jgi:predicted MFS family arabinose efflux permease